MPDIFGNQTAEDRRIDAQLEAKRMLWGPSAPPLSPGLQEDTTPFALVGGGAPGTVGRMAQAGAIVGKNTARRVHNIITTPQSLKAINEAELYLMEALRNVPPELARKMYVSLQPKMVEQVMKTMPSKGKMLGQVAKAVGKDAITIAKTPFREGTQFAKGLFQQGLQHPLYQQMANVAYHKRQQEEKLRREQEVTGGAPMKTPSYPPWEKVGGAPATMQTPKRPLPR